MDELQTKRLVRQLKILNIFIGFLCFLILGFIIAGVIFCIMAVAFVRTTTEKITDLQQKTTDSLNVQKQVCDSSAVDRLLGENSKLCQ